MLARWISAITIYLKDVGYADLGVAAIFRTGRRRQRRASGHSPRHLSRVAGTDGFIADLRDTYRRRPRLQEEFDRAGLP
jgi:hypothetical protein